MDSTVDSPISVIRIAICLSFRPDIICGTPLDLQLGFCASISALSPTILLPPLRAPPRSVVTTVFSTDAGCLFYSAVVLNGPPTIG